MDTRKPSHKITWIKRIGILGFLFFLIKGLVWLFIFLGLGKLIFH